MTFTPRATEAAAAHVLRELDDRGLLKGVDDDLFSEIGNDVAKAALTAALAVDGVALVPREPTAKMIAAAFPTEGERPPPADMKIGAEAIMILEGGRDCGSITGPAVIEAASMCKDYRKMIAAASEGEERK